MNCRRRFGAVAGMASLAILAVGCGNATTTAQSTTSARSTASPASAMLTGTRLDSLLLPAGDLPAGFSLYAPGTRNSAGGITPDTSSGVAASQVCERLTGTSWIEAGGIDGATFAEREYDNQGDTETIGEEVDTFHGSDAQKVMSGLWTAFGHCESFTQKYSGMEAPTKLVRSLVHGAGDQAIKAVETSPTFLGGTTLVAIRIGDAIVTCIYSSSHSDLGAPAVTWAKRIEQRIASVG
jgi:hypothetical protein